MAPLLLRLLVSLTLAVALGAGDGGETRHYGSKNVYAPSGRLVQAEVVAKLVDEGPTCVGVRCVDGVVLAARRTVPIEEAALGHPRTSSRLHVVDACTALLVAGLFPADGTELARWAAGQCREHRGIFGELLPAPVLARRLARHMHAASRSWSRRGYANALLVAGVDEHSGAPTLHVVDPGGTSYSFRGYAVGRGAPQATKALEAWLGAHNRTSAPTTQEVCDQLDRVWQAAADGAPQPDDKDGDGDTDGTGDQESIERRPSGPPAVLDEGPAFLDLGVLTRVATAPPFAAKWAHRSEVAKVSSPSSPPAPSEAAASPSSAS